MTNSGSPSHTNHEETTTGHRTHDRIEPAHRICRNRSRWLPIALGLALVATVTLPSAGAAADEEGLVAGLTSAQALQLGERMYREGVLPSDEVMRAWVQGDIEVDGSMFSCQSCHLRSGMGSVEGTVITQPTTGTWLYKPLVGAEMKPESQARVPSRLDPPPFRPAYDDKSLAIAIWAGRDPGGRDLHPAMPRYRLSHDNMEILVHYLKNLSVEFSPGVDETTLRFATVVSHDVSDTDRQAMLGVLEAHVRDHNSQSRHEERRATGAPFYKEEKYVPYRRYALDVWELEGDRESWPEQLDTYYRAAPVFALLGGIVSGDWAPVHDFSERNHVPCLFPLTDYPVISDSDWYTVYFSKGLSQEGETAARFLRRNESGASGQGVIQVFRDEAPGRALARGFAAARASMGLPAAVDIVLAAEQPVDAAFLEQLATDNPHAALALWLEANDLKALDRLAAVDTPPSAIFLSGSLLGEAVYALPEAVRTITYLTHPYSFPDDEKRSRLSVEQWLRAKNLPVTNFDIQAKMYFVGWTLSGIVKMMRDEFYGDYFLDILGMMRDQYYSIAVYPRLSFGPGQRYAAKGCYVAQLTSGAEPQLTPSSGWVIH